MLNFLWIVLQKVLNKCRLSLRRTPRSTTDGKVLLQQTDGLKSCGWTWMPYTRAKSKSTTSCPIHTKRQRWDKHSNTHQWLFLTQPCKICLSFPQRVALSFDFPFYGHYLRQVIIATGGEFLFYSKHIPNQKTGLFLCWRRFCSTLGK